MVQLPISGGPLKRIKNPGSSITINTAGKVLVIPTGNSSYLPSFNEYALNSNRLTIAESPFGGLKGSGAADYAPGTIYINSGDGVYLTDINGNNSTKTLTAGKLKEVNSLTVDTTAKTIEENFIIRNDNTNNDSIPLEDYLTPGNWTFPVGTGTVSIENGKLKVVGKTNGSGQLFIQKTVNSFDLSSKYFYKFLINSSLSGSAYGSIGSDVNNRVSWANAKTTMAITANTDYNFVLPFRASALNSASNPSDVLGTPVWGSVAFLRLGIVSAAANADITVYFGNISADVGKWATVEIDVPDNVISNPVSSLGADVSGKKWELWTYKSSAYNKAVYYLADAYGAGAGAKIRDLFNTFFADGTATGEVYRYNDSYNIWGLIPYQPGIKSEIKTKESLVHNMTYPTSITYSTNAGTKNRIGFAVLLPPSDSGRTSFNKIRLKAIIYYENSGANSYEFEDSNNASYGLQNMSRPFIALYDPAGSYLDFFLFTHRPKNLIRRRDDTGNIYEMVLYPGNGSIYQGRIINANLTADSNSNLIPNCLESSIEGSVTKFLSSYGMMV